MEEIESVFDDFNVEMSDIEVKRVNKFDRLQRASEGGSITSGIVPYRGLIYFASANHNIYCVRPENGKIVWKYKTDAQIIESTPVIKDGILYVASYDHNLYAIDTTKGTLVWKYKTGEKITATPAVSDDTVFIGSCDQIFHAVNRKSGTLLWKYNTNGWVNSEPLIVGNNVFFGSYDRFIYCIDKRNGQLLWKHETQGEVFNTIAFGYRDGIVYCPSMDGNTRAIDAGTGRLVWKVKLATYGCASSPVLHDDMILQTTRDGTLFALTFEGKIMWKFTANEEDVLGIPVVHEERIYVGSYADYNMYCLDMNGNVLWKFKTSYGLYERCVILGRKLIIGSWDCNVYCLDKDTQKLIWKFRADGSPVVLPPPHEAFELETPIPQTEFGETNKKSYDLKLDEDEGDINFYKSRITYQVSTQYTAKGKYQIDSREEE
ncbi:MAG: PQQ-binding-like beta-propeller repeat protein, partial [Candidatus Aenigmarchaeota archaeon]|nr:PQQ-binding-like beta-propeller repeat protein [Candidatus Aenigmarchaeota archaeon]